VRVVELLRELGHELHFADERAALRTLRLPTGEPELDALLGGGLPCGRLSEIAAAPGAAQSCGRTSLALALLAQTTQREELAAVVDSAGAFDPASAAARGVELARVLWARPREVPRALRCTEQLLAARGFALVLLDLVGAAAPPALSPIWRQLARNAAGSGAALVVLSQQRSAGSCAEVALELCARRAHFAGSPLLFDGLEAEITLARHRAPGPHVVHITLHNAA
jgi:RecA/RadA recombinase